MTARVEPSNHPHVAGGPAWKAVNILLTFHAIAFGLLLFSGRLAPRALPAREEVVDKLTCYEIAGYIWDREKPDAAAAIDIAMDGRTIGHVTANELREDLVERNMGTGRFGSHFALPPAARDGAVHWVEPVIVGTRLRTITGPDIAEPYIVHCPTPEKPATHPPATPALSVPAPPSPAAREPSPPVPATPSPAAPAPAPPVPAPPPPATPAPAPR